MSTNDKKRLQNVSWHKASAQWRASIQIQNKRFESYGKSQAEAVSKLDLKIRTALRPKAPRESSLRSYMEETMLPAIEPGQWRTQVVWAMSHMDPILHLNPKEITRQDVQSLLNTKAKTLSRASVGHILKVLRRALNLYDADFELPRDPLKQVTIPKNCKATARVEALTAEELGKMIGMARGRPAEVPLVLTGILGIGWEEIRCMEVRKGVIRIPRGKNEHRVRDIPIPEALVPLIQSWKPPYIAKSDSTVHHSIQRATGRNVGRHKLRHTCQTGLDDLEVPLSTSEAILGHAPRSTARKTYSHSKLMPQKLEALTAWANKVLHAAVVSSVVEAQGMESEIA